MYAGELAWGYYDHPPIVAALITIGKDWLPGELGLRFGHVLTSTLTITGVWCLLQRPRGTWLWLAAALVFSQPFLNVYGFIATPDGPLLLFTVLYLLAYRNFLHRPTLANGALWGLIMAGLLYAKYHGLILIIFTVLPHLRWLLRQPGAWIAVLGGAALYAPHLYWQYANDYPSFRYHLQGRNDVYQLKYTTEYLLNQLLIFNPLLLWFYTKMLYHYRGLFWARTPQQSKQRDQVGRERREQGENLEAKWADRAFLRANYWLIAGFFLFFLLSTTKGGTEAQWTALLSIPLCYLTFRMVRGQHPEWAPTIKKLGLATIVLLILVRVVLIVPRTWLPFDKPFDHEVWVKELQEKASGLPVMVQNSYRYASLYTFYSGEPAWTFTDVQYRQNQYDLWRSDSVFHNKKVLLLGQRTWQHDAATPFSVENGNMLVANIDSFQILKGVWLSTKEPLPDTIRRNQAYDLTLYAEAPLGLNLKAGNLPVAPQIVIRYPNHEMWYWTLRDGRFAEKLPPGTKTEIFTGPLKLFPTVPLGEAEIVFGLSYRGMPPFRGQSARHPVIIVD